MAFLSLYPNTKGFSVVIPNAHKTSDVLELDDNDLAEFIFAAKKVSQILKDYFKDVGRVGLIMEGTGIDHAHIKLFPMHETEYLKGGEWRQVSSNNDTFFDKYEGYISSNDSHKASEEELSKLANDIRNYIKQKS